MQNGLRVAAYYRMSSDEQSLSIAQQEKEVRKMCDSRGFEIVAEYHDKGKSGSKDIAKRLAFHRMIAGASSGKWQAIVCYDTSRFGRLDSMTGAPFKSELRKHGIYLETVKDGRIDWTTSMGRLTDALLSEKNHEYSLNLSHSVIRGRTDVAEKGFWAHGHIPYGYDREYWENGELLSVHPRTKKVSKARNWRTKLRVNEKESAIVKELFERLASEDISIRQLAKELNKRKVPSPGNIWMPQQLRHIFRERAYIGDSSFGFGRKVGEAHNRVETRIVKGACPQIVSEKLWEKCQKKIEDRRIKPRNSSQARSGALSGILICGHCGKPMHIKRVKGSAIRYVCSSGTQRSHLGCKYFTALESEIIPIICGELFRAVDAELIERLKQKPKSDNNEAEQLKKHVEKIEKQYERARANLLLVDPSMFSAMQKDVLNLKSELDKERNTLALVESAGGQDSWAQFKAWLDNQSHTFEAEYGKPDADGFVKTGPHTASPEALRQLLKSLNATFTLHWTIKGNRYYRLSTGILAADVSPAVSVDVSSDDTESFCPPTASR